MLNSVLLTNLKEFNLFYYYSKITSYYEQSKQQSHNHPYKNKHTFYYYLIFIFYFIILIYSIFFINFLLDLKEQINKQMHQLTPLIQERLHLIKHNEMILYLLKFILLQLDQVMINLLL